MEHTKGKWTVTKHATPEYAPQYGIYAGESPKDFCIVRYENAKANARLIAAAPGLLEACKALAYDLEEAHQDELKAAHHGDDANQCGYCNDILAAQTAIAAAEGSAQ